MAEKKPKSDRPGPLFWTITLGALLAIAVFNIYKPEPPAPPICADLEPLILTIGDKITSKPLSMGCSTHWIRIPKDSLFYISTGARGKEIHYLFSNGQKRHVTPKSQPEDRNFPTNEFRIWGDGTPTYTVLSKN